MYEHRPWNSYLFDGIDYATAVENACDPSHANFVHNSSGELAL